MEFIANAGKKIEIMVGEEAFLRHAVKTKFVTAGEDYLFLLNEYVAEFYKPGDILALSEKVISICQNRIVRREEIVIGCWAKFLSHFASQDSRSGFGVGLPIKMQYAINKAGLVKVLLAAVLGGLGKMIGKKGIFYQIVGREVSGLDGFGDSAWVEYDDIGIETPLDPSGVCNEIRTNLGFSCMIVDCNDMGQEILGKSADIELSDDILRSIMRDNPAGQGKQCTPIILIRKK